MFQSQAPEASFGRLPALDGIRIVAATFVVIVHTGFLAFPGQAAWWAGSLSVGVAIFFVLSGFVLFQPWVRACAIGEPRLDTRRFLIRRTARIVPAYFIVVAVCMIVLAGGGTPYLWFRHLTFSQIYTWQTIGPGLGQTWTLCVEITYYLVLPFFAVLVLPWGLGLRRQWRPRRTAALIATMTIVVSAAWLALLGAGVLKLYLHHMWLPTYAVWFGAGMLMATAYTALRTGQAPAAWQVLDRVASAPWACWGITLGLMCVNASPLSGPLALEAVITVRQLAVRLILHAAIAVTLLLPLIFGPRTRLKSAIGSRPMAWLGGSISYGLYLWHPFVLQMVLRAYGWTSLWGHFTVVFPLTMAGGAALGALSHYLVERPAMKLASRFPKGRGPRAVESQSTRSPITASA